MLYLTEQADIKEIILELSELEILWLDTEVADYKTKKPRLSLIQMLAHRESLDGSRTYLIDVLEQPELVSFFVEKIMKNPEITKVFHNAKYDLRFLGNAQAKNVICTLELAKQIPYYLLPVSSYSLKSLTEHLTPFNNLSKVEQSSDWGIRPLTPEQLNYAQMDCVYLREVYQQLIQLEAQISPDPLSEDLEWLAQEYRAIEQQRQLLDSQADHLKERLKKAMVSQKQEQVLGIKLSSSQRTTVKTDFRELVRLFNTHELDLDFRVTLTKAIQSQIGQKLLEEIQLETETTEITRLKVDDSL